MSLFFITFFLLYGGIHLYIFIKVWITFASSLAVRLSLSVLMLFMILAPVMVRFTERMGHEEVARMLAFIGYTWMGAILVFFLAEILCDLFRLILYISGILSRRDLSNILSAHRFYFSTCFAITLLVILYGLFEARQIRIEHIIIQTKKIAPEVGKVRVVQISDVHLGLIIGKERIKRIIKTVRGTEPDILVSTGDLVDVQLDNIDDLAELFQDIYTPYGKFAVTGNHEFYAGIDRALEFTKKAGFKILNDEVVHIPEIVTIAGADDEAVRSWRKSDNVPEEKLCTKIENSQYTILLKHRPVPYVGSICVYDLQLSGHTHKGQIFPFFLITKLFFKQYAGYYRLNNGSFLYVNRGTGTWGPPIRFLAPPEITVIDIVHNANIP